MLFRPIGSPEGPACPESVAIPVEGDPPGTVAGLRLTEDSIAGVIVRSALCDCELRVAEIVAEV